MAQNNPPSQLTTDCHGAALQLSKARKGEISRGTKQGVNSPNKHGTPPILDSHAKADRKEGRRAKYFRLGEESSLVKDIEASSQELSLLDVIGAARLGDSLNMWTLFTSSLSKGARSLWYSELGLRQHCLCPGGQHAFALYNKSAVLFRP